MSIERQSSAYRIRKAIDIDSDLQKTLSYQAVDRGMSLKKYMEWGLSQIAEIENEKILLHALQECESSDILTGEEKSNFVQRLKSRV